MFKPSGRDILGRRINSWTFPVEICLYCSRPWECHQGIACFWIELNFILETSLMETEFFLMHKRQMICKIGDMLDV